MNLDQEADDVDLGEKAYAFIKANPGCTLDDLEASGNFKGREHGIALAFALIRGWVYSDHKLRVGHPNRYYPTETERETKES